ncbi:UNVERIFIED_ORG: cellobiose-specific phosphotransferase system component IIC [Arthrobacter sp. UYCu721]
MTHRNAASSAGPDRRTLHTLLAAFTTAMLWWIGIVGTITTGGGGAIFLTVPTLATIGTIMIGHRHGRHWPIPTAQRQRRHRNAPLPAAPHSVVILCAFTTALLWWICITGLVNTGGTGAQPFLTVPTIASLGTLIIALRHRHGRTSSTRS